MVSWKAEGPAQVADVTHPAPVESESVEQVLEVAFAEAASDAARYADQSGVHRGGGAAGNILASVSGRLELAGELRPLDPVRAPGSTLTEAT